MIEEITKILYYFVGVLSLVGLILLFKKRWKAGIVVLFLILFCIVWRCFSTYKSYRYFSILIFFGVFLSIYAIDRIFRISRPFFLKALFFLMPLFLLHIPKCLTSFPNNYILDLKDDINKILENDDDDLIYVYDRESSRLKNKEVRFSARQRLLPESTEDITAFFLEHCLFSKNVYFVLSESKSSALSTGRAFHFGKNVLYRSKIEHHFSDRKRNKFISVYQYHSYYPSPDIDSDLLPDNAVLKAHVPEYDAFIYQCQDKLIWLVGSPLGKKDEIIYN